MSASAHLHRYTFAEYLDLEGASNVKHEFLNGEIYAMAGGTPRHAALTLAVGAALHAACTEAPAGHSAPICGFASRRPGWRPIPTWRSCADRWRRTPTATRR